ncbi:Na+/H+ antiporter subunit E [Actinopolymorpha singaporensis]|uniref:Multicomponent Na+:H+ antiporter subunit E n=1 Tax=Actinopolymorpha singaporensis TaxID=117157 RepID=A0A1H1TFM0_9ACTN|nr:Na+/H+ antiporter subunit E [Actinopolymorpha singaporensis]SDS58968.1 multicomponent Na+:H+ antiporter subunit E [Actinopolymorpha singaporensis]
MSRFAALWIWLFALWLLLTWTLTVEQWVVGALVAAVVAVAFAPLGAVIRPWRLGPRRLWQLGRLVATALCRTAVANARLAARIWSPHPRPRSGMLVVPTNARSVAEFTTVGVLTSLIVDNQLVDVHRDGHRLQYHAVWVSDEDPMRNRTRINAPVEDLVIGEDLIARESR